MSEFSVPTPLLDNLCFDVLDRDDGASLEQLVDYASYRFVCGIAVQHLCAPAPIDNAAVVNLPRQNRVVRLIQKVGLAPQQLFGLLAGGNVLDHSDKMVDRPIAAAYGSAGEVDPDRRTVLAHIAFFHLVAVGLSAAEALDLRITDLGIFWSSAALHT